jgi:asparagine synthase (glutamine-hydrolysing)
MRHRGPDAEGAYLAEGVALGIRRLAVIDTETGDQPIFNEDRSVVVVLNGEIYNYRELREELVARGHRFASRTDTEVIVHLYEDLGAGCVKRLRGMFAFALWDCKERRLLLARDRVGKKPLFYYRDNNRIWFGSEAKAILQDAAVPRRPDSTALDRYLQFNYVPPEQSAFAGVSKLAPGHTLSWRDGHLCTDRYWRLSYRDEFTGVPEPELHELLRERLLEATRLRLRSDVPLGAFLSGGVDSCAVVAAMARELSEPVKTFSVGFGAAEFDETAHAQAVASLYGTDHHELRVESDAISLLPRLVWHYDEPFADHSAIPTFSLAELTRREVTVALNGDGGDECFAGYKRYRAAAMTSSFAWVPQWMAGLATYLIRPVGTGGRLDTTRARVARVLDALATVPEQRYASWVTFLDARSRRDLYTPEFLETLGDEEPRQMLAEPYLESDATSEIDRLLDVDVQTYLVGDLLVKMDIATMAHSLEVRSPLLDQEFMQMAASLPADSKVRGGTSKRLFKEALEPWLPQSILARDKMGFTVPLRDWLRGELSELPREILLDRRTLQRGLFRQAGIERVIGEHLSGRRDTSNTLWALIQLELWMRKFIDGGIPTESDADLGLARPRRRGPTQTNEDGLTPRLKAGQQSR